VTVYTIGFLYSAHNFLLFKMGPYLDQKLGS
jgi:hypothetical protein